MGWSNHMYMSNGTRGKGVPQPLDLSKGGQLGALEFSMASHGQDQGHRIHRGMSTT